MTAQDIAKALSCGRSGCGCGREIKPGEYLTHCPRPENHAHGDRTPSLTVKKSGGKTLVKCFGGCSQETVVDALKAKNLWPGRNGDRPQVGTGDGLTLADFAQAKRLDPAFLARQGVTQATGKGGQPYLVFNYRDADGKAMEAATRFRFSMAERPKSKRGGQPALYGLWRLADFRPGGEVIIFEGESDTLTAWRHDLPAVGIPGKGLLKTISPALFKGFERVFVWQEPDAPELPGKVAARLPGITVKALIPPDGIKDISDAHCQGVNVPELVARLKAQAPEVTPPKAKARERGGGDPGGGDGRTRQEILYGQNLTDVGNGRRLVSLFGDDIRFCHPEKSWYWWTGQKWTRDQTGQLDQFAKEVARAMIRDAATIDDPEARSFLVNFALKSENHARRVNMLAAAAGEVPILPGDFDRNPWLFNCENGTIDLKTGKLRPYKRSDFITKISPVAYDPGATCPKWEHFLYEIFDNNHELVSFICRAAGYALTGDTSEQVLFLLHGSGGNGKSTALGIIQRLLGEYAESTSTETFLAKNQGYLTNDLAKLAGARLVTAIEAEQGRRLAENLVKELTGGDKVTARFMYAEYFSFVPQFKIFLAVNDLPEVRSQGPAIWRRIRAIPFTQNFLGPNRIKKFEDVLAEELPGILRWAVQGCLWWQEEGLGVPQAVEAATAEYKDSCDILGDFLAERCEIAPGFSIRAGVLYEDYCDYAQTWKQKPISQTRFGRTLSERGYLASRPGGVNIRHGLKLKDELPC